MAEAMTTLYGAYRQARQELEAIADAAGSPDLARLRTSSAEAARDFFQAELNHFPELEIEEIRAELDLRRALDAGPVEIVVTDFELRWSNGIEVLQRIKHRFPDCPVVINLRGQEIQRCG